MVNNQNDLQKRIENVEEALKKALAFNKLKLTTSIDFPKYRQLPRSLQLALTLIQEEEGIIVRQYTPLKKTKKEKKTPDDKTKNP